jgi:hypothetical protein
VRAVKEDTLIATVDIGAASNTGYCTTLDGRDVKPFRFDNSREGFDKFWHSIVASWYQERVTWKRAALCLIGLG